MANYLGEADVAPGHLLQAIAILTSRSTLDDLGRPLSPLVRRPPSTHGGTTPAVRALVGRWYSDLGADPSAQLDADEIARLEREIAGIVDADGEAT